MQSDKEIAGYEVLQKLLDTRTPEQRLLAMPDEVLGDDAPARVLRRLWPWLGKDTVLDFKGPTDASFRRGDLLRLLGCGLEYHADRLDHLPCRNDLTLVLVIPSITAALRSEMASMGWTFVPMGGGYGRIEGAVYDFYVVITDEVAETEQDDLLRIFGHSRVTTARAGS